MAPETCTNSDGTVEHDLQLVDDSFDHEFGTERVFFYVCRNCDHTEECGPHDFDNYEE